MTILTPTLSVPPSTVLLHNNSTGVYCRPLLYTSSNHIYTLELVGKEDCDNSLCSLPPTLSVPPALSSYITTVLECPVHQASCPLPRHNIECKPVPIWQCMCIEYLHMQPITTSWHISLYPLSASHTADSRDQHTYQKSRQPNTSFRSQILRYPFIPR